MSLAVQLPEKYSFQQMQNALIVMAVLMLSRLTLPYCLGYYPNFSIVDSVALVSGVIFGRRWLAFFAVLLAIWLSDIFLNKMLMGHWVLFYPGFYWQYVSYFLIICFGMALNNKPTPLRLLCFAFLSSVLFFLISNFGTWACGLMYALTIDGLLECYTAAIPFYKNTLLSDLFFPLVFFGLRFLAQKSASRWARPAFS